MKFLMKRLILFFCLILTSPLILLAKTGFQVNSDNLFYSIGCALSLLPGKIGSYIRVAYYKGTLSKMSTDVIIGFGSFFSRCTAEVGCNVCIGAYCVLGNVNLKDNVLIASRVSIPSGRHQHAGSSECSKGIGTDQFRKVTIGYRTWIGEGAIVMEDVGDQCIIGSGSVVTRPVPHKTVAAGNPARPLREKEPESVNS